MTNGQPATAKIYLFPIGGRATSAARRIATKPMAAMPQSPSIDVSGAGWYHAAAIQDAERVNKS